MKPLTADEIVVMFLALGTLLAVARLFGEAAKWLRQPAVIGELLAGIVLGPTVLGTLAPDIMAHVFPADGRSHLVLEGLTTLAVVLFLLVAGMEVDLSTVWRQGRAAATVGVSGIALPFAAGFVGAYAFPAFLGSESDSNRLVFALFFATAMSIAALPVIAKTLMDLDLYRTDMGMIVIAAAIFEDLTGWMIFAVVLGMMGGGEDHGPGAATTILVTLVFAAAMLTVGRWTIDRSLPWIQAHTSWPGGVLGFSLALAFFAAAFTEWIGIHAIFGAFLVGVAIGDSSHLREQTRATINQFVSFIFAPLFFATIGLKVNFLTNFDPLLTLAVLLIACVVKIVGGFLGARFSGISRRESWSIGFAMNARGAMEIILGLLALQFGIIGERLFVSLVIMALVTSIMSGPIMQVILNRPKTRRFSSYLNSRLFIDPLKAVRRQDAITELAQAASEAAALEPAVIADAVWARERVLSTGLGNGLAIPHARIRGLRAPLVVAGIAPGGIDFNAPDGALARIILLILTPYEDSAAQLEVLAAVARTFARADLCEKAVKAGSYTEFLALVKQAEGP